MSFFFSASSSAALATRCSSIFFESFGCLRRIELNPRDTTPDVLPTAMGRSVGHWEGDTLVVETTRVRKTGAGVHSGDPPASLARRFVERISVGSSAIRGSGYRA